MAYVGNEVQVENVHVNENPHEHNEVIEEDIKVIDVEEIKHKEGVHAEAIAIHPIDSMLAEHTISFLKGLAGWGMLHPLKFQLILLLLPLRPRQARWEIMMIYFILCWV